MKQIITKQVLSEMINSANPNRRAQVVGRALVALFNRQRDDEKSSNTTNHLNLRGFKSCHAWKGSIGAKYFLKHKTMQSWMVDYWTKSDRKGYPKISCYHRQLNEVANEKQSLKQ